MTRATQVTQFDACLADQGRAVEGGFPGRAWCVAPLGVVWAMRPERIISARSLALSLPSSFPPSVARSLSVTSAWICARRLSRRVPLGARVIDICAANSDPDIASDPDEESGVAAGGDGKHGGSARPAVYTTPRVVCVRSRAINLDPDLGPRTRKRDWKLDLPAQVRAARQRPRACTLARLL